MTKVRVGLIGCGLIAQISHLPYLQELSSKFEITALCDLSKSLVDTLGDRYNVPNRFIDYRELLDQKLDAVFILNRDHAPAALDAVDRNLNVFIEKPLCFNLEEADQLIEKAHSNHVIVMVGYMKRYDPNYEYALEMFSQLNGDNLVRVHSSVGNPNRIVKEIFDLIQATDVPTEEIAIAKRIADDKLLKGIGNKKEFLTAYSLLLHLWSHNINILRGAFGEPRNVNYSEIRIGNGVPPMPFLQILATLDYGAELSCLWETRAFVANEWWDEELALFGRDVNIKLSFPNPYLKNAPSMLKIEETKNGALVVREIISSYDEAYKRELKHFYDCIVNGVDPLTSAEDAKRDLEFALRLLDNSKLITS